MTVLKRKEIKFEQDVLEKLTAAASLYGTDLTNFIRIASILKADDVIARSKTTVLSNRDFEQMMSDEDSEPNQALKDLMRG